MHARVCAVRAHEDHRSRYAVRYFLGEGGRALDFTPEVSYEDDVHHRYRRTLSGMLCMHARKALCK